MIVHLLYLIKKDPCQLHMRYAADKGKSTVQSQVIPELKSQSVMSYPYLWPWLTAQDQICSKRY